jgi:2-dehydro-3-deoxyphosphogalactonate aldolase
MPHSDAAVIRRARDLGLVCTPGVATPTEAFAALKKGADALKMFPAENMPPVVVKAWRAVLPKGTLLVPVGGIKPETMEGYLAAGADGFGLGSALFAPGLPVPRSPPTRAGFRRPGTSCGRRPDRGRLRPARPTPCRAPAGRVPGSRPPPGARRGPSCGSR